ncbi:MAG: hypothetical protein JXM73_15345, partial [Anaerolineae bacterium]|nr:hypothetical protein [Anaerolineae bacterium]
MPDITELLRQGIAAAKAGQNQQARDLLLQVVDRDESNERAWLWLSGVVDSLDDRRLCLENVLAINPANPYARAGLRRIAAAAPPAPSPIPSPSLTPETEPAAPTRRGDPTT